MVNKNGLNLEIADSKEVAEFLGKLFVILSMTNNKKEIEDTCIYIGRLIFGLVLLDRISFKIDEPNTTRDKSAQEIKLKFH